VGGVRAADIAIFVEKSEMKRAFTLIELLVVIAIIAILAAILFPVFTKAKEAAKKTHCISNTKQTALAAMMYAGDHDDVLPKHDNNGSCWSGENPCDYPDWGDFRFPVNAGNTAAAGEKVMYWGAIEPYHKTTQMSICPHMGPTNWSSSFGQAGTLGITPPPGGYNKNDEKFYYNTMGQMALNLLIVDWSGQGGTNFRAGNPKGNLTAIARPGDIIMGVAESTWGYGQEIPFNLGNGLVWPSWPNTACYSYSVDGWTRYPHNGRNHVGAVVGDMNRIQNNGNLSGFAVFMFADGHSKPMKYTQAERCVPIPLNSPGWYSSYTTYYPHWVPEL
jgi:prepilin-type N-terminal cleavage/methylation domain-containing protein